MASEEGTSSGAPKIPVLPADSSEELEQLRYMGGSLRTVILEALHSAAAEIGDRVREGVREELQSHFREMASASSLAHTWSPSAAAEALRLAAVEKASDSKGNLDDNATAVEAWMCSPMAPEGSTPLNGAGPDPVEHTPGAIASLTLQELSRQEVSDHPKAFSTVSKPSRPAPLSNPSSESGLGLTMKDMPHELDGRVWAGMHRRGYRAAEELQEIDMSRGLRSQGLATHHKTKTWAFSSQVHQEESEEGSALSGSLAATSRQARVCRMQVQRMVGSPIFDYAAGFMVLCNAVCIGAQTEYQATSQDDMPKTPLGYRLLELFFCVIFTAELALRLFAHGLRFFSMPGWQWNTMDAIIVALQLIEEAVTMGQEVWDISVSRLLRIVRLLRVVRVVRILHLVRELRTMANAIGSALQPFFWTVLLLFLMIYIVGVYIMQIVVVEVPKSVMAEDPELQQYWSSLDSSVMSLFQALMGGVDWEDLVNPLTRNIHPLMGPFFALYVGFATFVMLNLINGIFFDLTFSNIRDTHDRELINQVKELVVESDSNCSGRISYEEFEGQVGSPLMKAYFQKIDLDISEAKGLFDLLDINGKGHVDHQDFVMGCLRLQGKARALDLAVLSKTMNDQWKWWEKVAQDMQAQLNLLTDHLVGKAAMQRHSPVSVKGHRAMPSRP
mmetsp:Transcript_110665/g.247320  ORF Transcript_110665/g.247320 Transcript_110665/m.247320 type:complete len:671 (+) Transcript_110665:83-2095(+)